jgi:hypothetical protein
MCSQVAVPLSPTVFRVAIVSVGQLAVNSHLSSSVGTGLGLRMIRPVRGLACWERDDLPQQDSSALGDPARCWPDLPEWRLARPE